MKKLFCSLITLIFIYSISNAQIKVSTSGTVSVGSTANATEALEVTGNANISGSLDANYSSIHTMSTNTLTSTGSVNASYADLDFLQVNNEATFDDDLSVDGNVEIQGDADINGTVDATNITSSNYIFSDMGFKTTKTSYYTTNMIWDRDATLIYVDYPYPTGSLGTSSHPLQYTHTKYLYLNGVNHVSDRRSKENIKNLTLNSLEIIKDLNPVKFDYKKTNETPDEYMDELDKNDDKLRKNKVGFIAQDVENLFPEAVTYDSIADQYYIDYIAFTPLLVKAVKEQQLIIESLQSQLSAINTLLVKESNKKSIEASVEDYSLENEFLLYQNTPNPFTEETIIKYKIPSTTNNARIIIHDMTGKQLKSYELHDTGESSINIYSGELIAGMYMYSLLVDGTIIDTKQMIITE